MCVKFLLSQTHSHDTDLVEGREGRSGKVLAFESAKFSSSHTRDMEALHPLCSAGCGSHGDPSVKNLSSAPEGRHMLLESLHNVALLAEVVATSCNSTSPFI